jgi:MFS family permease
MTHCCRCNTQRAILLPSPKFLLTTTDWQKGLLFSLPALPYAVGAPLAGSLGEKYGFKVCKYGLMHSVLDARCTNYVSSQLPSIIILRLFLCLEPLR